MNSILPMEAPIVVWKETLVFLLRLTSMGLVWKDGKGDSINEEEPIV